MSQPFKPFRRPRRGIPLQQLSPSEAVWATPGLRRRILCFLSEQTLVKAMRVSQAWFVDAVAVLYRSVDHQQLLFVAMRKGMSYPILEMGCRYDLYMNSIRQLRQPTICPAYDLAVGSLIDSKAGLELEDPDLPFYYMDELSLRTSIVADPAFFPRVNSMIKELPGGIPWGDMDVRKGGDRCFVSYSRESGYADHTIYIERFIGLFGSPKKRTFNEELYVPTVDGFETQLVHVIDACHSQTDCAHSTPTSNKLLPPLHLLKSLQHPVKALVVTCDIQAQFIIDLFSRPFPSPWPTEFDDADWKIQCDSVVGLGLQEWYALVNSPGAQIMPKIHLHERYNVSGLGFRIEDIYHIGSSIMTSLPSLRDLAFSLSIDDTVEPKWTHECDLSDGLDHIPIGRLDELQVAIHCPDQPSTSQTNAGGNRNSDISSFYPLHIIKRLASFVAPGGKLLTIEFDPSRNEVVSRDHSPFLKWFRAQPAQIQKNVCRMDTAALGIRSLNDLSNIVHQYGKPMALIPSLSYIFTAELGRYTDAHIRSSTNIAASQKTKDGMTKYLHVLDIRRRTFALNNAIITEHITSKTRDSDMLAIAVATLLADCQKAGMGKDPQDLVVKYPALFETLRKLSKTKAGKSKIEAHIAWENRRKAGRLGAGI